MSLVCLKWHLLEHLTRTSLTLRGNIRDLLFIPTCFRSVTDLDLSLLSPWGHPLLDFSLDPILLAHLLHNTFPSVVSLTIYIRNLTTLYLLAPCWPNLLHVKLVRWHQRSPTPPGSDFLPFFENCLSPRSPPTLETHLAIAASLSRLDILTYTPLTRFRSSELLAITTACPNLRELVYVYFVVDSTLLALASNCPQLSLLHLAYISVLSNARTNLEDDGFTVKDACISHAMLLDPFIGLPKLEELAFQINQNVRDGGPALELLHSKCPPQAFDIRKVSWNLAVDSKLDGVALCQGLESLSMKNCADLTDYSLIAISLGCTRLAKFKIQGCKRITETGISTMAHALCSRTNSRLDPMLQYLSLWIAVGELLTPLILEGLDNCPALEEIQICAGGDCKQ
ncbi:LOW QUALITY PROTEIN: hypothetical protein RJ641_002308 [Dillenia turbinata]|uniref:Uncharacterized protein n=1 Tax=Dillenia turbinata TaxID=194707 RepID=A0AAN8ZAA3_9MAGN